MLDPRPNVRPVDAVVTEQRSVMRAIGVGPYTSEIRDPVCAHVPALEHETRVVHAMVVVQMAEERVAHLARRDGRSRADDGARPGRGP